MTRTLWPGVVQVFRHAILPLAWYYAVTLAMPLANGAARAGVVFAQHALVVLVVPPAVIVLVCAVYEAAKLLRPEASGPYQPVEYDEPSARAKPSTASRGIAREM